VRASCTAEIGRFGSLNLRVAVVSWRILSRYKKVSENFAAHFSYLLGEMRFQRAKRTPDNAEN
jgi:hypothetical protein